MMNPWLLLGTLVFWIASLAGVYGKATHDQIARDQAAAKVDMDAKLKQAEENWAVNYQAQLELEQEKQRNERVRDSKRSATAKALAVDRNASACSLADASVRVLDSSIAASNGAADAAASDSDDGVQSGDSANGRKSVRTGDGTGSNSVDSLGVPTEPQGTSRLGH